MGDPSGVSLARPAQIPLALGGVAPALGSRFGSESGVDPVIREDFKPGLLDEPVDPDVRVEPLGPVDIPRIAAIRHKSGRALSTHRLDVVTPRLRRLRLRVDRGAANDREQMCPGAWDDVDDS